MGQSQLSIEKHKVLFISATASRIGLPSTRCYSCDVSKNRIPFWREVIEHVVCNVVRSPEFDWEFHPEKHNKPAADSLLHYLLLYSHLMYYCILYGQLINCCVNMTNCVSSLAVISLGC